MDHWALREIETPDGTRDPVVLRSDEGGRAILIGIGPGQELGEHQVKEGVWLTVLEGSVRVGSDGKAVEAAAGDLLHFDPDERHSVASDGGARILLVLTPFPGAGHYRGHEATSRAHADRGVSSTASASPSASTSPSRSSPAPGA